MQTIAEGKSEVLHFLEDRALSDTNENPGIYRLIRDDSGALVLFIEGWTFVGAGTVSLGGNMLTVLDGRVSQARKPS